MIVRRDLLVLAAPALALAVAACSGARRPCAFADACGRDEVCEVGRCARPNALPAASTSRRLVLHQADVKLDAPSDELRAGASTGGQLMLVRFELPLAGVNVESAFLVLTPLPAAPAVPSPIELDVARVLEPWTSDAPAWPRVGATEARARTTFTPPSPVRIDVTGIVRDWARTRATPLGFAIRSTSGDGLGGRFATGLGGDGGPVLDVYAR